MRNCSAWRLSVVVCLSVFTELAFGSNWVEAAGNATVTVYVDKQSLRRTGPKVKAWVKWEYANPREVKGMFPKQAYQATKDLAIYSCADRMTVTIQSTKYSDVEMTTVVEDLSGKDIPGNYSEVAPDTIGEALLEFACHATEPPRKK